MSDFIEDAARGLAAIEFDARVALPEAQERFQRAEAKIAELMEELELVSEQGRLVGMDADRYRVALEQIAALTIDDMAQRTAREALDA